MIKNKFGQASEGMSWIVATMVILAIVTISIFAASALANLKSVKDSDTKVSEDILMDKSIYSLFFIGDSDKKIIVENDLKKMSSEGKFNADFESKYKKIKIVTGK